MNAFRRIAVIGSGIMGHGIALVCARGGASVTLVDVSPDALSQAEAKLRAAMRQLADNGLAPEDDVEPVLERIAFSTDMAAGVRGAELIFEAVPERLPLKRAVYGQLETCCGPDAIFASNTSGIPINTLAALTGRPERFVGTHFFMPAHLIPLVEVVRGDQTRADVVGAVMAFLSGAGKSPVHVRRDIPGFIGNRLQHALAREAMSLVQQGVARAEDVDTVVKTSLAVRLLFTGPIEQRDFNGLDTHLSIAEYLYPLLEDTKKPLPLLADRVAAGELGIKTGKGFFDWTGKDVVAVQDAKNQHLIDVLKLLAAG